MIEEEDYQAAINKLKEIRKKCVGDWIIDPTAQQILTGLIDALIEYQMY